MPDTPIVQSYATWPRPAPAPCRTWTSITRGHAPAGNDLDTHRLWEMLFFGIVPIVKTGPLDVLYRCLPVIVLDKWEDTCRIGVLERELAELHPLPPVNDEVFSIDYWIPPMNLK